MVNYTQWPEKFVAVTTLQLDPENPRIPPTGSVRLDQRSLVAELVEHEEVFGLMKDIAETGYSPLESLIGHVSDDDGKTYILEGNRRLAALKMLISPDIAPDSILRRVRSLAKGVDLNQIKKVRVLFAPTRDAAAPLIMQKHTQNQIQKWSPLMQARFYRSLATAGLSAADMARRYGSTPGDIKEFLRTDKTYELACKIQLPDPVRLKVHDPRNFPVSVLQRLLDAPQAREVLGIQFDEDGAIKGDVSKDAFTGAFKRILTDIATDKLNTRTINSKADISKYLENIKDDLPSKKSAGKGAFTASDFDDKRPIPVPPTGSTPKKKPTAKSPSSVSSSVVPRGTKCAVKNARITEIFAELKQLRLRDYPNSSGVLFRILVELTIGHYLEKTGQMKVLLEAAKRKGKQGDWYPTLRQMLDAILKDTSIQMDALARKRIAKFVTDSSSPLSVDGLDAYVHNKYAPPTERELRSYWDTFEGIFEVVLTEPARKS